jgi:hypothetical protein
MKLTMLIIMILSGLLIQAQNEKNTIEIIKQLEERRRVASLNGDLNALTEILDPDFYEIGRLGVFRTRDQNINERRNGILKFDSLSMDSLEVKVFNDMAIVTGIVQGKGMYNNQPFQQPRMRYSRIYFYRNGKWRNIFGQNTDIARN